MYNTLKNGELGRVGQKRYGGVFFEEFVPELVGTKGVEVYHEMRENDDVIGAIMFAIEMLIRQATFSIEPASESSADKKAAEFVETCMNDMDKTWADTISEVLSFLVFGWSYHEIVYKRRVGGKSSKYDDKLIGWKKLPLRSQETLYEWQFDDYTDELKGMVQIPPPDYGQIFIPLEKALHFRTKSYKDNPEGRSILRSAYRSWYMKKRFQEIEGIGVERDLAGYPVLTPPEDVDIWDPDDPEMVALLARAETIIQNVRRDTSEGMVKPAGWTFELLSSGSRRQFEVGTIIERYDKRMATTVLADFIFLGQSSVGSFALSSDKTRLFSLAVGTYLDIICEVFNQQGIKRLIDINGDAFKGITDYPKMEHGDIEDANLEKFANYISAMVSAGIIVPDDELERFVRQMGNLPMPDETTQRQEPQQDNPQNNPQNPQDKKNGAYGKKYQGDGEEQAAREAEKDEKEAELAKKALGRL